MTKLTKILGKSYNDADFQNFLRKFYENVTKNNKISRKPVDKHTKTLRNANKGFEN